MKAQIPKPLLPIPQEWNLTEEQLYKIYTVEKEQAAKLRNANSKEDRKKLYGPVYEYYFSQLPFHSQFTVKNDSNKIKKRVDHQWHQLKPFMNKKAVFIELGAGDCSFSLAVSNEFAKVYALEVSQEITKEIKFPENVECVIFDGFNIPFSYNTIDVVYSNQLMEHLHPDDAIEQLTSVFNVLKKGGTYTCITPNKLIGPADISRFYTKNLVGFHLKEYSTTDLSRLFRKIGFSKVYAHIYVKGQYIFIPLFVLQGIEFLLSLFSIKIRKRVTQLSIINRLFNAFITAKK
jgi:ubiquinone/menaquinone biosynthesis C-methylase UbiE